MGAVAEDRAGNALLSAVIFLTLLSGPILMSEHACQASWSPGTSDLCDPYTLRKVDIGFGFGRRCGLAGISDSESTETCVTMLTDVLQLAGSVRACSSR